MKLLKIITLSACVAIGASAFSQQPYYSTEFNRAVENGTRTTKGVPGPNYKNNFVEYSINASFDPASAMLVGESQVVFHYNGGKYLNQVVFNLYRNIYKKGVARSRPCNQEDITDEGMEILSVKQLLPGNVESDVETVIEGTQLFVGLNGRLKSGDKLTLKLKWQNKVAANTQHRGGQYGPNSWMIPYWYPQLAVYDDIYGWDDVQHTANEEFLQEFANYDVKLTLGNNMCAWATGELQNSSEIYQKSVCQNIEKAKKSNDVVEIINSNNVGKVLKSSTNTWHFKADTVPDFVFACSDNVMWDMSSLEIKNKKQRTFVSTLYFDKGFRYVSDFTRKSIDYMSSTRPGYPYPYSHMTVFQGSGGMEFPMMVNEDYDGSYDDDFFTTSHEVMHSWTPFITGMYQNRFSFMDEGLTMFIPQYFQNSIFKNKDIMMDAVRIMQYFQGSDENVPMMTPAYSQNNLHVYTINSYYKPQVAYTILEEIVGEEKMTEILKKFVYTWAGKHPHPFDFFYLCEDMSGLKLGDFFRSWFFTTDAPDMAIAQVKGKTVTIQNPGGLMLPIYLKVNYTDGTSEIVERNALCWANGNNAVNMNVSKEIESLELGKASIPDIDKRNNTWKANK